jgi:hypothetical protein
MFAKAFEKYEGNLELVAFENMHWKHYRLFVYHLVEAFKAKRSNSGGCKSSLTFEIRICEKLKERWRRFLFLLLVRNLHPKTKCSITFEALKWRLTKGSVVKDEKKFTGIKN